MSAFVLNTKKQRLFDYLMEIPVDLAAVEHYLCVEALTADEVTRAAIVYAEKCQFEIGDWEYENRRKCPEGIVPGFHSTQLVEVIELLLKYRLQPNAIYENNYNIMDAMEYIDNDFLAADAVALLTEHGGNPGIILDGESLFDRIDFDIFYCANENDSVPYRVHLWMVLLAQEAKLDHLKDYQLSLCPVKAPRLDYGKPFDLKRLSEHRNYYYGFTENGTYPTLHIYDKCTQWEVARV